MGLFQFLAKFFMGLTIGELFVVNLESGIVIFPKNFEFTFKNFIWMFTIKKDILQLKVEYQEAEVSFVSRFYFLILPKK